MCTLTWWREGGGSYEVFFNRDERKTRSPAEPPEVHEREGVSFLAPIDPDSGGTWMLANRRGLLVCLLNRWHEQEAAPVRSRGPLVMEMAPMENVPAVEEHLRHQDLDGVSPFTMVGFDSVGERAWSWDGEHLTEDRKPEPPLCSSSFHYAEVSIFRTQRWQEMRLARRMDGELLDGFHSDTDGGPSAFTARMLRSDAQTVSRSRVRVTAKGVSWSYLEEARELAGEPRLFEVSL